MWRGQFGERNGAFGGWISKPAYDVQTAQPGQFLLDTNSQVFQCVAQGDTLFDTYSVAAGKPAGDYGGSVPLPPAFAGYSNLCMTVVFYTTDTSGNFNNGIADDNYMFRIASGTVYFNRTNPTTIAPSGGTNVTSYRASWNVYRAQF